jgi:hypothetical protein
MRDRRPAMHWLRAARLSEADLAERGIRTAEELGRTDPLWPGQLATLAALLLYLLLPSKLKLGPGWPLTTLEVAALVTLVAATRRGFLLAVRRGIAIVILLVAILANMVALGLLIHYLLAGGRAKGADLINGGVLIWTTNLLLFTVVFWELDRGGPLPPAATPRMTVWPDFLFPQMSDAKWAPEGWKPRFLDYLYVSVTNQSAFSPTDTMPLTRRAKVLMGIQGIAALVTVGIVVARAVNILG